MTDLIKRLRNVAEPKWPGLSNGLCYEAADEIERLRGALKTVSLTEWLRMHTEIERLRAVVDAVTKVTDRAAHDRSYDGNLIEDIRAALEDDDDPV